MSIDCVIAHCWNLNNFCVILALVSAAMKEPCLRCKRPTYFNDKIGPLMDGVMFHNGCFKCWICGTRLSLKTYHNNRNDTQDLEVYCAGHVPTPGPHDPIPHRSNLIYSPKTKGDYPHDLIVRFETETERLASRIRELETERTYLCDQLYVRQRQINELCEEVREIRRLIELREEEDCLTVVTSRSSFSSN